MNQPAALISILALALAAPAPAQNNGSPDRPIPAPHPVITEVLFAVPEGDDAGDTNKDGFRHPTGDQFYEITNPHDETIDVGGYRLSNERPDDRLSLAFTIPEGTTLEPGQSLVVFNGRRQVKTMPRPFGDKRTLCTEPNPAFAGAIVYSIKNLAERRGLFKLGDLAVLRDPGGEAIDVVAWGVPKQDIPDALRVEFTTGKITGSMQRPGPWAPFEPHQGIDGRYFSPGEVPTKTEDD